MFDHRKNRIIIMDAHADPGFQSLLPESFQRSAQAAFFNDKKRFSSQILQGYHCLPCQWMVCWYDGTIFAFFLKYGLATINAHIDKAKIHFACPYPFGNTIIISLMQNKSDMGIFLFKL